MSEEPAKYETQERGLVTYEARDGQEIRLSFATIKRYLVQGQPEMVTDQEMMYFMGVCKSRGLNPFIKDAYLIKYSPGDPAAIVTSIDYFRKRAKAQRDCKGWKKGIIVERKGEVVYSNGLMLEGDKLLGGWFEGHPSGWTDTFRLEVNLKGYIKRTKDGTITRFWSPENQPSQIMKVAESQGLRTLWPDEFQQLYTPEEMGEADLFQQAEGKKVSQKPVDMEPTGDIYAIKDENGKKEKPAAAPPEQGKEFAPGPEQDKAPELPPTPKAGRGRPQGSKNKPSEPPPQQEQLPIVPITPAVEENAFTKSANEYKEVLSLENWALICRLYGVRDGDISKILEPEVQHRFLDQCQQALDKQNAG